MTVSDNVARRCNLAAVGFALVFPTLITVMYFIVLAGHDSTGHASTWQQGAFGLGKVIQFAFPAVWVFWFQHTKIGWVRPRAKDVAAGAIQGLVLLAAALALYFFVMKPAGVFDVAAGKIREKIVAFGATSVPRYVALSVFYCVLHSLAEEYYWRWFVFAQLRRFTSLPTAIVVSGLGFMAHHVFIVGVYFGWNSPWTYFLSLSVAVGGFIWAWMYGKTGSLYGTWMSHALVDTAIFVVGYDVVM
ncbi:MAG TPA: CPBP family intramembrane glutamic endopeptidase [Planctomycetaceae bacterium]